MSKSTDFAQCLHIGAIHSFCRYLEIDYPQYLANIQDILSIRLKKAPKTMINYLSHDGIKLLLEQPNRKNKHERRDLMISTMLYDVGIRASEITEIKIGDLFLQSPASVRVHGKGDKYRQVPLMPQVAALLKEYLSLKKGFNLNSESEYLFIKETLNNYPPTSPNHSEK